MRESSAGRPGTCRPGCARRPRAGGPPGAADPDGRIARGRLSLRGPRICGKAPLGDLAHVAPAARGGRAQPDRLAPLTLMGGLRVDDYPFAAPAYAGKLRWATWHMSPRLREAAARSPTAWRR